MSASTDGNFPAGSRSTLDHHPVTSGPERHRDRDLGWDSHFPRESVQGSAKLGG